LSGGDRVEDHAHLGLEHAARDCIACRC
jgi:hypothetical protein